MGKYFLEQVRVVHPALTATIAVPTRVSMVRELLAAYPWIQVVETKALRLPRRDLVCAAFGEGPPALPQSDRERRQVVDARCVRRGHHDCDH